MSALGGARPPFIGRNQELEHLLRRDEALAKGRSGALIVEGPAGMGKTRLVDEFLEQRVAPTTMLRVRGQQHDPPPYLPFLSLFRQVLRVAPNSQVNKIARVALELLTGEHPATSGDWHRNGEGAARADLFLTVADAIDQMLAHHAVLFICEDLQWLDGPSAALLEFIVDGLLDNPPEPGVLVILTTRPNEPGAHSFADQLVDRRNCSRIRLQPLSDSQRTELLLALGLKAPPARVYRELLRQSRGNPLFLTEAAAQYLERDDTTDAELTTWFRRPSHLGSLVENRVTQLPAELRGTLSGASVLGTAFTVSDLQDALAIETDLIVQHLTEAIAHQLLVKEGDQYRFVHDIWHERLYHLLTPTERINIHDRVARAFVANGQPTSASDVSTLSHHLRNGSREDLETLHRCCERAGDLAARATAWADAAENYAAALSAAHEQGLDTRVLDLHLKAARAHDRDQDIPVASALYESLAILARDAGNLSMWSAGLEGQARISTAYRKQAMDGSLEATPLAEFLREVDDDAACAPILTAWANLESTAGRSEHALSLATRAIDAAERAGIDASAAHFAAGYSELITLRLGSAIRHFAHSYRTRRKAGDSWTITESLTRLAWAELMAGELDAAVQAASEAIPLALRTIHLSDAALAEIVLAAALTARGDFDQALEQLERAERHAARSRYQAAPSLLYPLLATIHRLRGDHDNSQRVLDEWEESGVRGQNLHRLLLQHDLHPFVEEAGPRVPTSTNLGTTARLAAHAELAGARGDTEHLEELYARLSEREELAFTTTGQLAARLRAVVAHELGRPVEALDHLDEGIRLAERAGAATELALSHLLYAKITTDPAARREHGAQGADLAQRVGLAPYLYAHLVDGGDVVQRGSRGEITIVFSDLASSTQLSVEFGDDAYLQAIDHSRKVLRARCADTGGTEFGTQGDGFLAYFTKAVDAVDFALATMGDISLIDGSHGPVVELKIGIATGRPILRDGSVYGQTVNLAARLSDRARPGEVVSDGATRFLTEGTHQFEGAGAAELKGFPELVPTHLILASRPRRTR